MNAPPKQLGLYILESCVASGGMGEIWRAHHIETGEVVAIKRLLDSRGFDERTRARLLREAQALERVDHESVVRYYSSGVDEEGLPYIVIEWLEGEDLLQRQRRAPLDLAQTLEVARQVLGGLAACHESGLIHRDLKPSNIFLVEHDDGRIAVKLVDFGLVLALDDSVRLTAEGAVVGTCSFMSPEQARGIKTIDHRTDIYSVGVVLYLLCSGRLPFLAETAVGVLIKIATESPPRPRHIRPHLPEWLDAVIMTAISRAPSMRFSSARSMLEALQRQVNIGDDVPVMHTVTLDDHTAFDISLVSRSIEVRLVSLLCIQAVHGALEDREPILEAIRQRGGETRDLLGGRLLLGLFGIERTSGDEVTQAIEVGLEQRQRLGRATKMLVATIHVQVGEGLQLYINDLDETIDMLQRLPPGQLVVDAASRKLAGERFEMTQSGVYHSVVAHADQPPVRRRVLEVETPLVGRETELASLRAAFYRVLDNEEADAVLITGPAGSGKSRLLFELLPEIGQRSALRLHATASAAVDKRPFSLFADGLRRAALLTTGSGAIESLRAFVEEHVLGDAAAEVTSFVAEVLGLDAGETALLRAARQDVQLWRERVRWALRTLFAEAARAGPVCLVFEDVHRADAESIALVGELLEELEELSLFVALAAREGAAGALPPALSSLECTRLQLPPLRPRAVKRLVRAVFGGDVSKPLLQLVVERCDGNPYFVEELLAWLMEGELLLLDRDGWRLRDEDPSRVALPVALWGAIQGRLDHLESAHKELLKVAAVFGETFWQQGCEAAVPGDIGARLEQLEREGFVVRERDSRYAGATEWRFRQTLLCQVAYEMIAPSVQASLHALAARWLESVGESDAALLAFHFDRGGDPGRACDYYRLAGRRALIEGRAQVAQSCFGRTLEPDCLPESARARLDCRRGLVRACIMAADYQRATAVLDEMSADSHAGTLPDAQLLRARVAAGRGEYAAAEALLQKLASAPPPELRFEVGQRLFWAVYLQGRYAQARELAVPLVEAAELSAEDDKLSVAKLAAAYGAAADGDLAATVALSEQAIEHARRIGHRQREVTCLTVAASALELIGRYERAAEQADRAVELARAVKLLGPLASAYTYRGRAAIALGDGEAGLEFLRLARETAAAIGDARTEALALVGAASAHLGAADHASLTAAADSARVAVQLTAQNAPPVEIEARLKLARALVGLARVDEALAEAERALEILDELGGHETSEVEILLDAHDVLDAAGKVTDARALLPRALDAFRERESKLDETARAVFGLAPYNARLLALCADHPRRQGNSAGRQL
ncbi:MAG: protein kinase [Myxococcales bacterium]|nr:protein kinase [Myxococcales bacterium]